MTRFLMKYGLIYGLTFGLANFSFAAPAGPPGEGPCAKDAETLCPGIQHGDGRLMKCMREHQDKLSPECKAQHEKMKAAFGEVKEACHDDIAKLCADVKPGKGRIMACMRSHREQLSEGCKKEFAEMKAERKKFRK